jgi:hypothetical protein
MLVTDPFIDPFFGEYTKCSLIESIIYYFFNILNLCICLEQFSNQIVPFPFYMRHVSKADFKIVLVPFLAA